MPSLDMDRAFTFGAAAREYARWRPGYPDAATDFLCPTAPACVLDLGAGTGQLTEGLLGRGAVVHALDADFDMLEVLSATHPTALVSTGRADDLPYPDASMDAVLVATAFHWFPFEATVEEVRRVLKPGGWLGLVYNLVTPVSRWERDLIETDPDQKGSRPERREPTWAFPPGRVDTAWFPWDWQVTPEHYRNCLATNSAFSRMPEAERRRRLDRAEAIIRDACAETRASSVPVHHEAFCLTWTPEAADL